MMMDQLAPLERLSSDIMVASGNNQLVADHFNRYQFCQQFVSGRTVLDAGCGIGFGAHLLARAGARHVDAIDISPEAIVTAREQYKHPNVDFKIQDLLSFSGSGSYDLVVSFETIEHIVDTGKYLQVIYDILKPDGIFVVSTPNRKVSNPKASRFDKPKNPFHQFELTREEFVELLGGYFVVEEIYGQRSYYYKGTRIRTLESIFVSKRLRHLLNLPEANYWKFSQVRRTKPYYEPAFFVAHCLKKTI